MSDGPSFGSGMGGLSNLFQTLQNIVKAIGSVNQTLSKAFPQTTGTATSATIGANGAPPAQVAGYLVVTLPSGVACKVPYYNT